MIIIFQNQYILNGIPIESSLSVEEMSIKKAMKRYIEKEKVETKVTL